MFLAFRGRTWFRNNKISTFKTPYDQDSRESTNASAYYTARSRLARDTSLFKYAHVQSINCTIGTR